MRCLPQKHQNKHLYAKRKEKKKEQNGYSQAQEAFEKEQT
jgi:hypothetical protein